MNIFGMKAYCESLSLFNIGVPIKGEHYEFDIIDDFAEIPTLEKTK